MKQLSTFLAVVLLVGGVGPLAAQQAGEDILVMVDVSKSMLRDQLFSRVQQDLAEIAGSLKVGDRLIVYAFGSDVLPVEEVIIAGSSDIAASRRRLANLRADQDWTYLTRAIDVAARRFGELQELDRDRRKTVFILTDGENDPPPWAGEDVISFADIVRVHGASLCSHAGAVYLVTFGVDMPPGDAEQIGLIQCLEVISEPRQAERGTAMPAILRVLPEEQTVAVGALGEEPVFVEVSFALIRLPGLRGPVRVSLVPEPVDGLQTAGPVEFTLQEDSATATLGMEVSREAMAEGRARVLIRAGAGAGVRVDPETLIVVFESAPDPLLSWPRPLSFVLFA